MFPLKKKDIPEVTAKYKMEDMYADLVSIDDLPLMQMNDMVTISGYIRQVIRKMKLIVILITQLCNIYISIKCLSIITSI